MKIDEEILEEAHKHSSKHREEIVNYPSLTEGASWFNDNLRCLPMREFGQFLPYCVRLALPGGFTKYRATRRYWYFDLLPAGRHPKYITKLTEKQPPLIPYLTEGDFSAGKLTHEEVFGIRGDKNAL